ncbi:MAG: sensor histidine kinase, partial [Candidatus Hermodarchaeia archaeon]
QVVVSDTGCGLSAESTDRIFEPFFSTNSQGLGIGLSISRSIIEAHGGRIWAESNPAGGATFRFTLPM